MKYLLLLIAIVFLSCSRNGSILGTSGEPEISFDMDGKHIEYKGQQNFAGYGVGAVKSLGSVAVQYPTTYNFSGITSANNLFTLIISTQSDTLKVMTYSTNKISLMMRPGTDEVYGVDPTLGDLLNVTITGYSNAIVNGTFSGKATAVTSINPLTTKQVSITNGKLQNIRVRYP